MTTATKTIMPNDIIKGAIYVTKPIAELFNKHGGPPKLRGDDTIQTVVKIIFNGKKIKLHYYLSQREDPDRAPEPRCWDAALKGVKAGQKFTVTEVAGGLVLSIDD